MMSSIAAAMLILALSETSSMSIPCTVQHAAAVDRAVWLLCDREQLLVSEDRGVTWRAKRLLSDTTFRAVAFLDSRRGFVVGDNGTLMATADGGNNWRKLVVPAQDHLTAVHFVGESGWVAGRGGVMFHTADGGQSWERQSTGTTQSLEDVFFADSQQGWAVGWVGTILRTSDGGRTWVQIRTPALPWSLNSVYFRDRQNGWVVGFGGQILRSRDGGATWQEQASPVKSWLKSVMFDRDGRGWIAADNELLVSDDGGDSWQPLRVGDALFLRTLVQTSNSLWAVGEFGVLRQDDSGRQWQRVETRVPGGDSA